jgi:hypothetical protein
MSDALSTPAPMTFMAYLICAVPEWQQPQGQAANQKYYAAKFFRQCLSNEKLVESLREEMWIENRGTESFSYNLETNHRSNDQCRHLTFFRQRGANESRLKRVKKKGLARLTPKETIAPASTMADTHIKKNLERRTIQRRRRNWHDLYIASAENPHSNQQQRKSGR